MHQSPSFRSKNLIHDDVRLRRGALVKSVKLYTKRHQDHRSLDPTQPSHWFQITSYTRANVKI